MTAKTLTEKVAAQIQKLGITPGYWNSNIGGSQVYVRDEKNGDRRLIVNVDVFSLHTEDSHPEVELAADSRLMSGSKELLTAVLMAKEFERHAGGAHLPANEWFKLHEALDIAILKATGYQANHL